MAPTNQIVDAEVSHAPNLVKDKKLEVTDRSSEHHQIYPPMFNFSPTRNRPLFLRFPRRGTPPISRLVGLLLLGSESSRERKFDGTKLP